VLLALPSTPATRHILNARTFAHLRPTAVVVNVGRGDTIDTDALVTALDTGKLSGAALDVVEPEPLPAGHTLYGRKNVVLTPHMSGRTERYMDLALDIFIENLERLKNGKELLNVVDPRRGY
jgi:phosphoglycerate dehydrogenase-like enzyme